MVAIASRKPPLYTIKDEQDEIIRGKFFQRVDRSLLKMDRLQKSSFQMHLRN